MKTCMLIIALLFSQAFCAIRISTAGTAPDIVVDKDGDLHAIYLTGGTYKYRKISGAGSVGPVIDVGYGVELGDATRSYGEIVADSDNQPHIFTGPGYAYLPAGAGAMVKVALNKRDNTIAIDGNDKILIVFRGTNTGEYSGPGMIQGRIKTDPEGSFGSPFNLDQNILARNNHVYGAAMAGPDNRFHVIFRHGPDNSIYYMQSSDGETWTTGEKPGGLTDGEGPRIVVTPQNRVLVCDMLGNVRERTGAGAWVSRGKPVDGADRMPPALAADNQGNVYITANGGQVAVLKAGSNSWGTKILLLNSTASGYAHPATGADNCTYVIYQGTDGIYVASVDADGNVGDIGSTVVWDRDYRKRNTYDAQVWTDPMASIRIYDVHGRLMKDFFPNRIIHQREANGVPAGVYIIRADIGRKTYIKKAVVRK